MNFVLLSSLLLSAGAVDTTPGGVSNMRGFARGADAVTFDPAATAFVDGFELQYEQFSIAREHSLFGAYTVIPTGPFRMHFGYEWVPLTNRSFERASVGGAFKLGDVFAMGFTYRGLRAREDYFKGGGTWDVGLYAVPTKWLSFSLGLDDIGNPYLLNARQNFSYVAGLALRPIAGAPWLTVGAQSRLDGKEHEFTETRAVIDVGSRGLHAYGAYDFQAKYLAIGLQVAFGVLEVRQAFEMATGDKPRPGTNREELASATVVTFRSNPSESIGDWFTGETVELALNGDLRHKGDSVFPVKEVTPSIGHRLRRLSFERTVGTVVLKIGHLDVGMGFVDELRGEIQQLRKAGKKVIAEIGYAGDKEFLVAAAADHVRLDKSAVIGVDGFALIAYYFAAALENIGVRFDVVAIGRYKTAPDALTMSAPKPEEDEVRGDLLAEADKTLMHALTVDRRLSAEDAAKVVALGGMRAVQAQQYGLVDEIAELDMAQPDSRRAHTADDLLDKPRATWGAPNTVAVVPVVGTIVRDDGDNPLPGESASAKRIVKELEDAANDPSVIGVVLRVDSGGGEVFASELIYRAVKAVQKKKPIVASMADTAASGGYYVVAPCDAIYAEPNTLTGSIGIFQLKVDLAGFFDLTEIKAYTYKTGPLADWRATTHGFTDAERERLTQILNEEYDVFLGKVAEGRHMTVEAVRSIAEGHVYTGRRAKELGLVDELGGLADAVESVKARARVHGEVALRVPKTVFSLSKAVLGGAQATMNPLEHIEALKGRLLRWEREPLALLPQTFEVRP